MDFQAEQKVDIERLAGLGYSIHRVAMYLDIPAPVLLAEYADEDSPFRYHYDRGVVLMEAKIGLSLMESAEKGNIMAIEQAARLRAEQHKRNLRIKIFGRDL